MDQREQDAICRCVVGLQLLEARSTLRLLQWNLHSECFLPCAVNVTNGSASSSPRWPHCDAHYPNCGRNATHELLDLLRQVDFAGIEQLSDQDFWQSLNSTWGQIHHSCGGTKGFGVYPFDLASLLYRQTGGWAPSGQPVGGCMEKVNKSSQVNDYRAYVGQAFVHKDTGLQVIVMVAHFPHEGGYEAGLELLSAELQDLKRRSGVEEVLLLADTNQQKGNAEIMHDIDASSSAKTAGNDVQITCCYPEYFFSYDRIIAQNLEVTAVKTSFPFGIGADHHPPAWAVFNMHDPVLVELEMRGEPRSWAKAPSPAVLLTVLLAVVLAW